MIVNVKWKLLLKSHCWRDRRLLLALEWFEKSMALYTIASVDHITLAGALCSIPVFDVCPGMAGMNWFGWGGFYFALCWIACRIRETSLLKKESENGESPSNSTLLSPNRTFWLYLRCVTFSTAFIFTCIQLADVFIRVRQNINQALSFCKWLWMRATAKCCKCKCFQGAESDSSIYSFQQLTRNMCTRITVTTDLLNMITQSHRWTPGYIIAGQKLHTIINTCLFV